MFAQLRNIWIRNLTISLLLRFLCKHFVPLKMICTYLNIVYLYECWDKSKGKLKQK